jgi:hypothetical protein
MPLPEAPGLSRADQAALYARPGEHACIALCERQRRAEEHTSRRRHRRNIGCIGRSLPANGAVAIAAVSAGTDDLPPLTQ